MKRSASPFPSIVASVVLLALTGACSKHDDHERPSVAEDLKTTARDVAREVETKSHDAWDQIRGFAYDQRTEFAAGVRDLQRDMDRKVQDLKQKSPDLSDAAARERAAALRDYEAARTNLQERMTDLGNASSATWAKSKADVSDAWSRLKASYAKLSQ